MPTNDDVFDLVAATKASDDFRRVLQTGDHLQVVAMTIAPGETIGAETRPDTDQVLYFIDGVGEAVLDGTSTPIGPGQVVFVHAGVHHDFRNTGDIPLRIATAYAPPEHEPGTVHPTKQDEAADPNED